MKSVKTLAIGALLACLLFPGMAQAAKPLLIIADVSGSMQEAIELKTAREAERMDRQDGKADTVKKVVLLKKVLVQLGRTLSRDCPAGLVRVRYIAGDPDRYTVFLPVENRIQGELLQSVKTDFVIDYPRFNRRSPLADGLRQLDGEVIADHGGAMTLLFISDGKESFYDLDRDREASQAESIEVDDPVQGPLTELRRLLEKYPGAIDFHAVYIGQEEESFGAQKRGEPGESDEKPRGQVLLEEMAALATGRFFSGPDLLNNGTLIAELSALLCPAGRGAVPSARASADRRGASESPSQSAPEAGESGATDAPVPVPASASNDRDRDGVVDSADRCPATPRGARVNAQGCWVLEGVLFAYDKAVIRPQFYPKLDEVLSVLRNNPDLRIRIEGHTDNIASAEYNQKLSLRRAKAVHDYLVEHGIQAQRLSVAGFGFSRPVASNATAQGRAKNRRVELTPFR